MEKRQLQYIASILLLISAIIAFVFSAIALIFGIFFLSTPGIDFPELEIGISVGMFVILISLVLLIFGLIRLWCRSLINNPRTIFRGGIITLVIGILVGPDLLMVVAGILAIIDSNS